MFFKIGIFFAIYLFMNYYDLEFFKGFTKEEINTILKLTIPVTYGHGETILKEGETSHLLMLITEGKVKVIKKIDEQNTKVLAILETGELFGEMSFFDEGIHNTSVIAHSDTSLLVLGKNEFELLEQKNPILTIKFLKKIIQTCSSRIRFLNEEIKQISNWCITLRMKNK
ncbi:MAG: cyclic nucleotide-binding domain-containing protein [Proteobacteria bacterium]|nr:cyclic nucleotide-binding domain-containing protein [Pseudomonadota bacterium]